MFQGMRKGFTLIELLVVIVVIGMIVSIAIPSYNKVRIKARETEVTKNLSTINQALNSFGVDHNGLYPYRVSLVAPNGQVIETSDLNGLNPLGLFGGVPVVDKNGNVQTAYIQESFVQPRFPDAVQSFYRFFNLYTDPLVALGYLSRYPRNPFFPREDRGMGSILWAFDRTDLTIPSSAVIVSPGDFVYTFNMGDAIGGGPSPGPSPIQSDEREDPDTVVPRAVSYQVELPSTGIMYFSLDLVDAYQLWAYGNLPLNGPTWAVYPNNAYSPAQSSRGLAPRRDFNGNGVKDMFERGIIAYYSSGGKFYEKTTSTGEKIEF